MKYIAFLRAINVGGHVVKMTVLAGLFDELGFEGVETFIASGNVAFQSRARSTAVLERTIAEHLRQRLGYAVDTFIRTTAELQAIAAQRPFPAAMTAGPKTNLYVAFFHDKAKPATVRALSAVASGVDRFQVIGREVYWLIDGGFAATEFSGAKLEKLLGAPTTIRNIKTVKRLVKKYEEND